MEETIITTVQEEPTESQVQVLMSDWMGNLRLKEEGNFTHAGKGGIEHNSEESYSEYLIGDVDGLDEIELIRQARSAAKQVVNAIVNEPTDVHVGGTDSYHVYNGESRTINLATDYFDDEDLTPRQKVDVMLGIACHESAHAVYTDQSTKQPNLDKEEPELQMLKKTVWNIIEDERIEYHLGEDRPGLAQTLGEMKGYFYKKVLNDMKVNGEMPTEPIPKLLSALTSAVRYPSEMTREEVIENFAQLDAIRKALTPYPMTPQDAWDATERVMNVIRETAKKEIERQRQEEEQQQGPGAPQPQGGDGQDPQQPQNGQDDPNGQPQQEDPQQQPPQGQRPEPTPEEVNQAIQKALGTEQGQKVMQALQKDDEKCDGTNGKNSASAIEDGDDEENQYVNEDDAEVMGGGPGDPQTFIFKPKGSAEVYNKSLKKVRKYIPAMSKALSCKSRDSHYVLHGLPAGKLNTNRLVALKCGNTNIFDKKGCVVCSSASVCMLIDESGSMDGDKLLRTREAAILVREAIARIKNVNFYCYGYTDDRITVFSETAKTNRFALSETAAIGGTPTGLAMRRAAERVRRYTHDPVLMLVLTDGGADRNDEVVRQRDILSKRGFTVIGVGIQSNVMSRSFDEYVVVRDISTFAVDLAKLTKGKLDKMLVRHEA